MRSAQPNSYRAPSSTHPAIYPALTNAGSFDELWQLERRLLDAQLALQVLALLGPVARHRHRVAVRLQAASQWRRCGWVGGWVGKAGQGSGQWDTFSNGCTGCSKVSEHDACTLR